MYTLLYIALYSITLYYIILYCIVLHDIILYYIILFYFVLHDILLYYIILYYILLYMYILCIYYVYNMCILSVYSVYIVYIYIYTLCVQQFTQVLHQHPVLGGQWSGRHKKFTASADFRGFHPGVSWLKSSVCRQKPSGFWSIATGCELETMAQQ